MFQNRHTSGKMYYFCHYYITKVTYREIISAIGSHYLEGKVNTIIIDGKFCMVDNMESPETDGTGGQSAPAMRSGGFRFPLKVRMSFCLCCLHGCINVRVQQKEYHLEKGCICVIYAGQILENAEISEGGKVIFVAIDTEYAMTEIRSPHGKSIRQLVLGSQEPALLQLKEGECNDFSMLYRSVRSIIASSDKDTSDGVFRGFSYIFGNMLLKWVRNSGRTSFMEMPHEKQVFLKFRQDIHAFAHKDRSVAFYARRQCMSPRHFARLIRMASGRKPLDIIQEYVILEAKSLLLSGKYSVKEVCERLGFINHSFFSRYFRTATGLTPGEFLRGGRTI